MSQNRPQNRSNMNRNRPSGQKRRPYDQNKDTMRRTPSQNSQKRRPSNSNYGYQETVEFPTRRQSGSSQRSYNQSQNPRNYNSYQNTGRGGNSIEFPTQNTHRPQNGQSNANARMYANSGQSRNRSGQRPRNNNTTQYPGNPSGNRPRNRNTAQQRRQPPNGRLRPTQATMQNPERRERKKKRRMTRAAIRRRRLMRKLTAFALLLCVIGVGIYLTGTMLFKISSIQVQNADGAVVQELAGYSSDQILSALGVQIEENIFTVDSSRKAAELEKVFPKLESIRVVREYPGTVVVRATEATPSYAMQVKGGWLTLSAGLKILDKTSTQPSNLPTLYGGEPVSTKPGDQLNFETEAASTSAASDSAASSEVTVEPDHRLESLNTLMAALENYDLLDDVTRIEFEDTEEMAFLYQDRISVLLGTLNELDYKLKLGQYVLLNEDGKGCAATDTGMLDLSHLSASSTRKFRFAQGEPTLPSGYVVPEKIEPVSGETTDDTTAADSSAETADETTAADDTAAEAEPTETTEPTAENQTQTTNQR